MHELLLSGQVLLSRHEQVLKIFAGVTGMQPRRVFKRHILYKPLREPEEPGLHRKRGGTQDVAVKNTKQTANKDLYVTQLVQQLDEDDFSNGGGPRDAKEDSLKAGDGTRWTWLFNDVPEAGDRDGVNVRMTHTTDILHGDVHAYMVDSGNQFVTEYYTEGHEFVNDNVVVHFYRILHEPGVRALESTPKRTLPSLDALKPFDPSGAYIVDTTLRILDLNDSVMAQAGVDEMNRFRAQLKGCVELKALERIRLDTRVKYVPKGVAMSQTRPRTQAAQG